MSKHTGFRLGALAVLMVILGAGVLLWPIPTLGGEPDLLTGVVLSVAPGSPADAAGLRPGDRITHIYGYPWAEINTRTPLLPLPWRDGTPTPVTVERAGKSLNLGVLTGSPSLALQVEKLLRLVITLICWATGFALGTSPRADDAGLRRTGWFWIALAGSMGVFSLAQNASYVVAVGVLWLQSTVLAPAAIAVQLWYPPRPARPNTRRSWWLLVGAVALGQLVWFALALRSPTTIALYRHLLGAVRLTFLASFGLCALLLWQAYRKTIIAHVRRQIRLIGAACALAGVWAALLVLIHWLSPRLEMLIPPAAFQLGGALIPLAYLAGGTSADLMQLDRLVRRVLIHALTILSAVVVIAGGVQSGLFVVTPALLIALLALLYIPLYGLFQRWVVPPSGEARRDQALQRAAVQMRSSLEAPHILEALRTGIDAAFQSPPLAIYHRAEPEGELLTLVSDQGLGVPHVLDVRMLELWKRRGTTLLKASSLQRQLGHQDAEPSVAELAYHPAVVLWGAIRDQNRRLLAAVLLGPRGDDDPYSARDARELEQLLGTAALALTNSASYAAQVAARAELRELWAHAEQIEEQTAVDLANEIHDEVLSTQLRYNREQVKSLVLDTADPTLRERLEDILGGEDSIDYRLRLICEQLKPTGLHDPLGLVASLQQEKRWLEASWEVPVEVSTEHEHVPLSRSLHRALVKIAHEALSNAAAHGQPTAIAVRVVFPTSGSFSLVLSITNDGPRLSTPIVPKRSHWGVRNMREYAEGIGATIRWERPEAGGVRVVVEVPPAVITRAVQEIRESTSDAQADELGEEVTLHNRTRALGEPAVR